MTATTGMTSMTVTVVVMMAAVVTVMVTVMAAGAVMVMATAMVAMSTSKTIRRKIMWSQFPPNLSHLHNNPPENNVEPVPAKSELPPKQSEGK